MNTFGLAFSFASCLRGGDGGLNLSTLCPATVTTVLLQAVLGGGAGVRNVSLVFDLSISDQNSNCVFFFGIFWKEMSSIQ